MDEVTQVQILDKAVCILSSANALGKCLYPTILLPASGKLLSFLNLVWWLDKRKENSKFKPVKLHLKTDLVLYPGGVGQLYKYDNAHFLSNKHMVDGI